MAGLRDRLATVYHTLVPLTIAALILVPRLPVPALAPAATRINDALKTVSLIQRWNMYAPDPQTAHTYMVTYAELADGSRVRLREAERADAGWSTVWGWEKTRVDIWTFYAILNPDKVNRNRTWYLRGVCVREALARGEAPRKVISERVRRRILPPDEVRAGQPGLGPLERYTLQSVDCRSWPIREMIAEARARQQQDA